MAHATLAQLTLVPPKVLHSVILIFSGFLQLLHVQTRMNAALVRVTTSWRQQILYADAVVLLHGASLAQLTLTPSKMRHAVMPIKWGFLEFAARQTRI
jgi:hypothetical protein